MTVVLNPNNPSDLIHAIKSSNWDKARQILQTTTSNHQVEYVDNRKMNALHCACYIHGTPIDLLHSLLTISHSAPLAQEQKFGRTPLHMAIDYSTDEIIQNVIDACPKASFIQENDGFTPLHSAIACYKSPQVIQRLLETYPHAATVINEEGNTPLDHLIEEWNVGVAQVLLCTDDKHSILNQYVYGYKGVNRKVQELYDIIILLIQAHCHLTNNEKFRPLHTALRIPNFPRSFLNLILKVHPKEVFVQDEQGNLPLHLAASSKGYETPTIIQTLLQIHPEGAKTINQKGRLPFHFAIESHHKYFIWNLILKEAPHSFCIWDEKTRLLPFMMVAVGREWRDEEEDVEQLASVYRLLRMDPSLLLWKFY